MDLALFYIEEHRAPVDAVCRQRTAQLRTDILQVRIVIGDLVQHFGVDL